MRIKERKQTTEETTIAVQCDVCGKIQVTRVFPDDWRHFSRNHNRRGKYSVASYESYDVCSPECYIVKFKQCLNDFVDYDDGEIDFFKIQFAKKLSNLLSSK